jgi:hypothetical protein
MTHISLPSGSNFGLLRLMVSLIDFRPWNYKQHPSVGDVVRFLSRTKALEHISFIFSVLAGCDCIVLRRTPSTNPRIRLFRSPCPICLANAIDATSTETRSSDFRIIKAILSGAIGRSLACDPVGWIGPKILPRAASVRAKSSVMSRLQGGEFPVRQIRSSSTCTLAHKRRLLSMNQENTGGFRLPLLKN